MNLSDKNKKLKERKCIPCSGATPSLKGVELKKFFIELGNNWHLIQEHHIEKEYSFKDFQSALDFVNKVGAVAEVEGHHPDLLLSWGKVKVTLFTHKINGLSESDFILAAKCDALYS